MRKNKLGGLREPVQDGEAANKRYVDNYVEEYVNDYVEKFKDENDNFVLPWEVNMAGKKLSGLSIPSKSDEAATKSHVDEVIKNLAGGDALVSKEGVFLKENGHYRATAPLDIDNNKIENLPEPKEDSDAATKKYVDDIAKTLTLEEALIKENGGYNVANAYINMNFNNIKNIGEPGHTSDAATKGYVDESITNKIENLPQEDSEAANKKYVDNTVKKSTHMIAAHASYQGDLIKGEYQFTFGGGSVQTYKNPWKFNGFLMPHSGYIKRFVLENLGFKVYYDISDGNTVIIFVHCNQVLTSVRSSKYCQGKSNIYYIYLSFPKQAPTFTCLQKKPLLKTLWEKGKLLVTSNLSFPRVLSTFKENFLPFSLNLKFPSANSFSLEETKICRLGGG